MSRQFFVDLHAANISANPHPKGIYEELIKRVFAQKQPIEIWGDRYALMTELHWRKNTKSAERAVAYGTISTFTDIDTDAPWLNRATGKAAEEEETSQIVIPRTLRPHFAQFLFYFDLNTHMFVFQGNARMPKRTGGFKRYSLTPGHMKNYLIAILESPEVKGDLDSIGITIVPDPDKLNEILRSDNIREITMTITVPNSDNVASERGRVRARMTRLNSKKRVETYVALDDKGVKPDPEMIQTAKVSALDGQVTARVATNEGVVPLSTADKPLAERVEIDTNIEPEISTIRREAERVARSLKASDDYQ